MDIGHAEVFKQAAPELLELSPDHVHVSDSNLEHDAHLAVGDGKIDFRKWFYALKRKGFNGKIMVEAYSLDGCVRSANVLETIAEETGLSKKVGKARGD